MSKCNKKKYFAPLSNELLPPIYFIQLTATNIHIVKPGVVEYFFILERYFITAAVWCKL